MAELNERAKSKILQEGRDRFKRCEKWEMTFRTRYDADIMFAEGDSDNMYQWPEDIRARMEANTRAMLTVNQVRQFNLNILNDARQSRIAIKVRPTGGGASFESAQTFAGVIRHIEYISNASTAYQTALGFAVKGGIGYWRVTTDYANDESFDQEIFVRRIKDPKSVYLDPDIVEFDGSDAKFGFIFTDTAKPEYEKDNPGQPGPSNTVLGGESWVSRDMVRSAEYFRRVQVKDKLLAYPDPEDPKVTKVVRASELDPKMVQLLMQLQTTKVRPIKSHKVEWFKIVGDDIVDHRDWPGVYIPIVRCVGEETVINGELDRKGHTRALKDGQRMLNYNASGSVEFGALQSKTPYTGPADAIEGYETYWETANVENHAYLPFNHRDDEGEAIPAPIRQEPPRGAPVYMEGMKAAAEWLRMASGQWQSDLGMPSNERSGAAINARQRQGDNATFHFLDHQSIAIRFTAKILIDLIPKIYDTARVLEILAEDGTRTTIKIDPDQQEAMRKTEESREEVAAIFNPKVGRYEVEADTGPAFQTQRQEAWNAYVQILSQNKDLTSLIGDLAFRVADFPGAEEVAERLKRMVPAQALHDGPPPDLVKAQQQIEALQELVKQVTQKLADKTAAHLNDQEKTAIIAYDSQTKRLAALKDAFAGSPQEVVGLLKQVIAEAEATSQEGLMPALEPEKELGAEAMAPVAPPQQGAAAGLPQPGPPGGDMGPAGGNGDDMVAAPGAGGAGPGNMPG